MMRVKCPKQSCHNETEISEVFIGRPVRCRKCGTEFTIKKPAPAAPKVTTFRREEKAAAAPSPTPQPLPEPQTHTEHFTMPQNVDNVPGDIVMIETSETIAVETTETVIVFVEDDEEPNNDDGDNP